MFASTSTSGTSWTDTWQAVGSMGTLAVALAAAVFAYFQVREAAKTRRDQARPYVVAFLERSAHSSVDLIIKNFGQTAARDIRLVWDRPVRSTFGRGKGEEMKLPDALPILAPGQEWKTVWDFNGRRIDEAEPAHLLELSFRGTRRREVHREEFEIGSKHLHHEMRIVRNGLHEINDSLGKIERRIAKKFGQA
ncbi:hypothetical protein [Microcella humidisoli]|uniref:SRPBCC family protein n=1 Tax=Microcella humidisoli TaxID=2963406 RepID=A0ABY5FZL9_9MICO|nr:hypothetical protein [Microcella humidisoli]UTT63581.1 hypothetical protein NNL39_05635 [Microcella humidisoli]